MEEKDIRFHAFVWKRRWIKVGEYRTRVDAVAACMKINDSPSPYLYRIIAKAHFPKVEELLGQQPDFG
jgi:hypothetical protein